MQDRNKANNDEKTIFVHIQSNDKIPNDFIDKIVMPVVKFVKRNPSFKVIYGTDSIERNINYKKIEGYFSNNGIKYEHYRYHGHWEFCYFLSTVDIVITRRLHVGILGCLFKKCVFSFPIHQYKTLRFYRQIKYESHCVPYMKITGDIMFSMLSNMSDDKASISAEEIELARSNIFQLVRMLKED